MKAIPGCAALIVLAVLLPARAGYDGPYSLGRVLAESTNIVVLEVTRVDREKSLIYFKKLEDLKGKHAGEEIVHDMRQGGIFPHERPTIMAWAEEGKRAVFFHNGLASVTCTGPCWYQAYRGEKRWSFTHVEGELCSTYYGVPERLADAVRAVVAGKEVVIPCLADGHLFKVRQEHAFGRGNVQLMRASLKIQDYSQKRDRVEEGPPPREVR